MVNFVPGEYYHLYNRGNSKQKIFLTHADYERFLKLLFISNSVHSFNIRDLGEKGFYDTDRERQIVNILGYCLMPNHFHIVLTPLEEGGVSTFMLKLSTSYAMYFNKKNVRSGSLFEGPFKSQYVDSDRYLKYLFAYIHLNPIKLIDPKWKESGIRNPDMAFQYLMSYKYSSLTEYLENREVVRKESNIIDKDLFKELFPNKKVVLKELNDWLLLEFP